MGWWTWGAVRGALVRRLPATVVNVSDRGCLIEMAAPLEPGTIALLEVHGSDRAQSEAVRVCHSIARPGAAVPFRAGTEFLVLDAAFPSVGQPATWAEIHRSRFSSLPPAGENSGSNPTTLKGCRSADTGSGVEDP
jgi:hypothetical protein